MQANAGKMGGTVQSLLIKHSQIKQNVRAIGKKVELPKPSRLSRLAS